MLDFICGMSLQVMGTQYILKTILFSIKNSSLQDWSNWAKKPVLKSQMLSEIIQWAISNPKEPGKKNGRREVEWIFSWNQPLQNLQTNQQSKGHELSIQKFTD